MGACGRAPAATPFLHALRYRVGTCLTPWPSLSPPWRLRTQQPPQIQISENAVLKVDEIQKPIIGGAWTTKTDFGRLEIKIVPYWTGECTARNVLLGTLREGLFAHPLLGRCLICLLFANISGKKRTRFGGRVPYRPLKPMPLPLNSYVHATFAGLRSRVTPCLSGGAFRSVQTGELPASYVAFMHVRCELQLAKLDPCCCCRSSCCAQQATNTSSGTRGKRSTPSSRETAELAVARPRPCRSLLPRSLRVLPVQFPSTPCF